MRWDDLHLREQQVATYLLRGMSVDQIAGEIQLNKRGVEAHLQFMVRKTRTHDWRRFVDRLAASAPPSLWKTIVESWSE